MKTGRLEAFSDGVLAIIITIMVLELEAPKEATFEALRPLRSVLLSYVLSFVYVGIYANNHHHLLQASQHVSGGVLWANLHLLFWLSLTPFVTAWLGATDFAAVPAAAYGFVLLMAAIAYSILSRLLVALDGRDSPLAKAIGRDAKGWTSMALYAVAMAVAWKAPILSCIIYAVVAAIWLIPDRRIERKLEESSDVAASAAGGDNSGRSSS